MKYCPDCLSENNDEAEICEKCKSKLNIDVPVYHVAVGSILNGKYVVGKAIGEGGFGITYIGRDISLNRLVAIKEYFPNGLATRNDTISQDVTYPLYEDERVRFFKNGLSRFLEEARILAKFSGIDGIVDIKEFFEENHTAYIVMEYLKGKTLKELIKERGKLSYTETVNLLMPVLKALEKIHKEGLIHRDIAPDNIMIVDGKVKLLDFGAAKNISATGSKSLTVMLKEGFAPEEQYRKHGNQGPWTDIYALSATMYNCITGMVPDGSMDRVGKDEIRYPGELNIEIDFEFEKVLMKGMRVYAKDRYQNIGEFIQAIQNTKIFNKGNDHIEEKNKIEIPTKSNIPVIIVCLLVATAVVIGVIIWTKNRGVSSDNTPENIQKYIDNAINNQDDIENIENIDPSQELLGEDYSKTSLTIMETTVTRSDIEKILKYDDLKELCFIKCNFKSDSFDLLADKYLGIKKLVISECSGINNYGWISQCSILEQLEIKYSDLSDEAFNQITFNGDNLLTLDLSGNQRLTDISNISKCHALKFLQIDNDSVKDLSFFNDIKQMVYFSACNNVLTTLNGLETAIRLETVYVAGNELTDISGLQNCTLLKNVNLNDNNIDDIGVLAKNKETIERLYFNNNNVSGLKAIKNCSNIEYLSFADNEVSDLKYLKKLTKLKSLNFSNNKIESFEEISECKALETLIASGNNISICDNLVVFSKDRISSEPLFIDISRNKLSNISFGNEDAYVNECMALAIYGNELDNIDFLKNFKGSNLIMDYSSDLLSMESEINFSKIFVVNCPLDKEVATEKKLGNRMAGVLDLEEANQKVMEMVSNDLKFGINGGTMGNNSVQKDE